MLCTCNYHHYILAQEKKYKFYTKIQATLEKKLIPLVVQLFN